MHHYCCRLKLALGNTSSFFVIDKTQTETGQHTGLIRSHVTAADA